MITERIKKIRRELTSMELEAGVKHPDKSDFVVMAACVEEIQVELNLIANEILESL